MERGSKLGPRGSWPRLAPVHETRQILASAEVFFDNFGSNLSSIRLVRTTQVSLAQFRHALIPSINSLAGHARGRTHL